eukprot:14351768-Alexandrium_andersonii.AAC.1
MGGPPPSFPVMTPATRGGPATDSGGGLTWSGFVGDDTPGPLDSVLEQFPSQDLQATQHFMVAPGDSDSDPEPAEGHPDVPSPPVPDPWCCLLYTSDAADDM